MHCFQDMIVLEMLQAPEEQRSLKKPRYTWENNIKTDIKKAEYEDVN